MGKYRNNFRLFGIRLLPALLATTGLVLSGCQSSDISDLNDYVGGVKARKSRRIDPLPEIKGYESYTYVSIDLRDPFKNTAVDIPQQEETEVASNGLSPDRNRNREELENHPLDSLRMVGTLEQSGQIWAIINASDGTIHRVTTGNFLGQNFGEITNVADDNIALVEIIPDGMGGWMKRDTAVALTE